MPLPFILGAAAAVAGLAGLKKGVDGIRDSKEADEIQEEAQDILDSAKRKIDTAKNNTSKAIQELGKVKLQGAATELKEFVDTFSKIKNVKLSEANIIDESNYLSIASEGNIKSMNTIALGATQVLSSGIAGVGTGALLGWGTYGGVMALGSASTGAAIAGLSGAAATNATLAWLGGGAIAAGGGGMALGTMVLGGIVAGPALLVAGGIFSSKAKEKLNNAYSNLAKAEKIESDIENGIVELNYIKATANQVMNILNRVRRYSSIANSEMIKIVMHKTNWDIFSQDEKNSVAVAVKQAQLLKKIIDTPLLTENGILAREIKEITNL